MDRCDSKQLKELKALIEEELKDESEKNIDIAFLHADLLLNHNGNRNESIKYGQ
jgi:hypothetical protein